jgi:hypothetical protein
MVLAALVPQALVAVTLNIPLVAAELKSMVTELPVPLIVCPVPLYDHVYVTPDTNGTA